MNIHDSVEKTKVRKTMASIYRFSYVPMVSGWTDLQGKKYPPRELGKAEMTIVADSVIEAKRQLEANVADDEKGATVKDVVLEEVSPWMS